MPVPPAPAVRSSSSQGLALDTDSVARLRHASALGSTDSSTATLTMASSTLARVAPLLLVVLQSDEKVSELEQRLQECAMRAEHQVNAPFFGDREPTPQGIFR